MGCKMKKHKFSLFVDPQTYKLLRYVVKHGKPEMTLAWRCLLCGHRQEMVEHEEWPMHCSKMMKMQPYYRIEEDDHDTQRKFS